MTWLTWTAGLLGILVLAWVSLSAIGDHRWTRAIRGLQGRLASIGQPARYDARELEGLPAPVQRYFRAVLKEGQPLVAAVTLEMAGSFNMSRTGQQWRPFMARQRVITRRPGFLWDARIALVPGVAVRVVDSYIAGQGLLHAAIQGLFTVAEVEGEGEIARGEFMRWLAEAAWYPTALLPSQGVRWEAVDEHSANAMLVDGPLTLTLLFRFDDSGLIGSFRAEARGAMAGGKMVMVPWEGVWSNYQVRNGMRVPLTGEVAWMRPEGRQPYFIGTVSALTFEFSP
jgi:hypothetical protein